MKEIKTIILIGLIMVGCRGLAGMEIEYHRERKKIIKYGQKMDSLNRVCRYRNGGDNYKKSIRKKLHKNKNNK